MVCTCSPVRETGLGDGRRVPKDHPRVEAIGEVDTLNSQLGLLLASLEEQSGQHPALKEVIEVLSPCQHRLFDLGGELARGFSGMVHNRGALSYLLFVDQSPVEA